MQRSALCRSRQELSNAYLLAKIGVDTAENEPLEVWGENSILYSLHSLVAATAGPAYANVTAVAAGVPFAVRVVGFNMSTSDRARIIASPADGTACASANAGALRGPLAEDPNLPGALENGDVAESGRLRPSAAAS